MDINQLSDKLPDFMNTESKYAELVSQLQSIDAFLDFLEDRLFPNSVALSQQQVWDICVDLGKKVADKHKLDTEKMNDWFNTLVERWTEDSSDEPMDVSSSNSSNFNSDSEFFDSDSESAYYTEENTTDTMSSESENSDSDSDSGYYGAH